MCTDLAGHQDYQPGTDLDVLRIWSAGWTGQRSREIEGTRLGTASLLNVESRAVDGGRWSRGHSGRPDRGRWADSRLGLDVRATAVLTAARALTWQRSSSFEGTAWLSTTLHRSSSRRGY
jgi:hypothetical protein